MLRSLAVNNFKPFGSFQTAELAPLTLIYGPNSGGKSSIIQALLLLKQSFADGFTPEFPLMPRGDFVDLGSFKSMIHRHLLNRELNIGLSFEPFDGARTRNSRTYFDRHSATFKGDRRTVQMYFSARPEKERAEKEKSERAVLSRLSYDLAEAEGLKNRFHIDLRVSELSQEVTELLMGPVFRDPDVAVFDWAVDESLLSYGKFLLSNTEMRSEFEMLRARLNPGGGTTAKVKRISLSDLVDSLRSCNLLGRSTLPYLLCPKSPVPSEAKTISRHDLMIIGSPGIDLFQRDLRAILQSIEYLGPLRSAPERHYFLGNAHSEHVGKHGENTPQMLYYRSKETTNLLNKWLEKFEIPYTVSLGSIGDEVVGEMIVLNLQDQRNHTKVTTSDVGFGIGQLLPVLVQGIVSTSQVLCVEQPEIHLHPRLQGALGDFFLSSSGLLEDSHKRTAVPEPNQWLVETHSESIILRVLKRIREGSVDPSKVSVLYVNPVKDFGSEILRLRIDPKGKFIDEWPQGCFEETFQEMFF